MTWLFTHVFVFQAALVPTASMKATLTEGDYMYINKLAYGARMPMTPLSLPIGGTYLDWLQLPYWRMPRYTGVQRNDVIVFNLPMDDKVPVDERANYVKRCVALPGDTISLQKGVVVANHQVWNAPATAIFDTAQALDSSVYTPAVFPHAAPNTLEFRPFRSLIRAV